MQNDFTATAAIPGTTVIADTVASQTWQRRYWLIFFAQALSLLGSSLTQFVLLWWITDTTGKLSSLATAGLAALLPQALLSPLGGVLADRYSRRRLMIVSDAISALCILILILLFTHGSIALWHVYGMMFIRSAMQAIQQPAAAASLPMLVPEHFLPRAIGLNQMLLGISLLASAPLGALALALWPMSHVLLIDIATAILGILPLLVYAIPQARQTDAAKSNLWLEMREGYAVIRHSPVLWRLFWLVGIVTVLVMPSFTLLPLLVSQHFGGGASEVALLEGLAGAGMILGGLLATTIAPRRKIWWSLLGFALACFALGAVGLISSSQIRMAAFWWALSSLMPILGNTPLTTLLQTSVANHLQGRVLSLLTTIMAIAAPLGLLLLVPLGELVSVRWLFVAMGVLGSIVTLAGFCSPVLRQAARAE